MRLNHLSTHLDSQDASGRPWEMIHIYDSVLWFRTFRPAVQSVSLAPCNYCFQFIPGNLQYLLVSASIIDDTPTNSSVLFTCMRTRKQFYLQFLHLQPILCLQVVDNLRLHHKPPSRGMARPICGARTLRSAFEV